MSGTQKYTAFTMECWNCHGREFVAETGMPPHAWRCAECGSGTMRFLSSIAQTEETRDA